MPTHYHLLIEELVEKGRQDFVFLIENSYSHYFNLKYNRKGHLWQNRYRKPPVHTDNQFLHATRYIHINPVKSKLVLNPKDWLYSSYLSYVSKKKDSLLDDVTQYMDLTKDEYKTFVESYLKETLSDLL